MDPEQCVSLLKEWQVFCEDQCLMHDMCSDRFKKLNYWFAIPAILLSTVGGTANIGVASDTCQNDRSDKWLSIFFGSIGLLSAALFTIHRYMDLPELQQKHEFYSGEYAKLFNEIKMHLFINHSENPTYKNLVEFVKACKTKLDSLIDKSPPIVRPVVKKFERHKQSNKADRRYTNIASLMLFKKNSHPSDEFGGTVQIGITPRQPHAHPHPRFTSPIPPFLENENQST